MNGPEANVLKMLIPVSAQRCPSRRQYHYRDFQPHRRRMRLEEVSGEKIGSLKASKLKAFIAAWAMILRLSTRLPNGYRRKTASGPPVVVTVGGAYYIPTRIGSCTLAVVRSRLTDYRFSASNPDRIEP